MENKKILRNIDKNEQGRMEEIDNEAILSQVTGGGVYDTVGGLGIATAFGAGVGALMGSNKDGAQGAAKGAGIGAGVGLGVASSLAGLDKWAELKEAAKKAKAIR
jgi:hypothetical protein